MQISVYYWQSDTIQLAAEKQLHYKQNQNNRLKTKFRYIIMFHLMFKFYMLRHRVLYFGY